METAAAGFSQDLLLGLIEASLNGVAAFDKNYHVIYWGNVMEQITGIVKNDIIGKNIFDVFPVFKTMGEDFYFQQTLMGNRNITENGGFSFGNRNGHDYFQNHYLPLRNQANVVIGGIVIVRDLTDWHYANQTIMEVEKRFRVMSDYAPVALWMSGVDGLCEYFNQGWLDFTGRTLQEELGVGWAERIHPEDFQKSMDIYFDSFNAKKAFTMEYRLQRHDGEYRWILDNGVPRYTPDGDFVGYIGSCIDITDQKSTVIELGKNIKKLKEALQVRDDFLSIASHELKTPLTPLKIQLQLLKRHAPKLLKDVSESNPFFKNIEIMEQQIEHILKLVEDFLDVTRMSNGLLTLNIEEIDLVKVVTEKMEQYQSESESKQCKLELTAPAKLTAHCDKFRIEQVVANLLSNAIKYGIGKPIEISLFEENEEIVLRIRDHGIGIAKDAQTAIFERFIRAVPLKSFGGLGLGLYITKQNVLAHGGKISVISDIGRGSLFEVRLPICVTLTDDAPLRMEGESIYTA